MHDRRKHALPVPQKKTTDVADVIWGEGGSAFATQAISDATHRQAGTGVAIPCDSCVQAGKDWVDHNQK